MKKLIINVVLNLILFISNNETAVTLKYNKINEIEKREFYEVDYVHPEHHFIDGPQFIPVISNDKHKFPFLSIIGGIFSDLMEDFKMFSSSLPS